MIFEIYIYIISEPKFIVDKISNQFISRKNLSNKCNMINFFSVSTANFII
jgi:hypothetical protein